jgi:DNA segregation ATPase FtsK/SpoIIIE-like protein
VASAEDAKVAAGLPRTGAERLLGKGDFYVIARGEQFRIQGAYASPAEVRRLVGRLARAHTRKRRPPREGGEPDAGTPLTLLGQHVVQATRQLFHRLPVMAR